MVVGFIKDPLFRANCRIHPLNSHLNANCRGTDEEEVAHVTAFAAPQPLPASTPCFAELDTPSEAPTTRHWVRSRPGFAGGQVRLGSARPRGPAPPPTPGSS